MLLCIQSWPPGWSTGGAILGLSGSACIQFEPDACAGKSKSSRSGRATDCRTSPACSPTSAKVEFINRIVAAGTRRVEAASFVNPKRVPQMADAEAVMKALPRRDDVHYVGLVLNRRGFDRAVAAGCDEVGMAVVDDRRHSTGGTRA